MEAGIKKYDYSKLDEFFDDNDTPGDVIPSLEEMRTWYLELSLYVELEPGEGQKGFIRAHDEVIHHSYLLGEIIKIFKSLKTN